ncbi:MAG: PepSY-associated TM helix domain-containing protein [Cycloclasticus sp.]
MNGTFRQSMSWLHTWAGLVLGWLLYFMFITGAIGYFYAEVDRWMKPEAPLEITIDQSQLLRLAENRLAQVAADATYWSVDFPTERYKDFVIWWKVPVNKAIGTDWAWKDEKLAPNTGQPIVVRNTGGGEFLYRMHFSLHYIPTLVAYWVTSLAAMFMLLALITGIIIHKKIFKDFFTFRPGKKQRSWLDMHNVLSVLPLPFYLMITYSGLILLMFTTMPGGISASYGVGEENKSHFFKEAFNSNGRETSGLAAKGISMSSVLVTIEKRLGKNQLRYIEIENRGDNHAYIRLARQGFNGLSEKEELTYDGITGELIADSLRGISAARQFYDLMNVLHEGKFSNTLLRCLYFISSLMGAGMIATGLILWAGKRRSKAPKGGANKGLLLVEYTNSGVIIGLPIAIAAYFWANRLIPVSFEARADWEVHVLFITWTLMLLYPVLISGKRSLKQVWLDQLLLAAVFFSLIPLLNFLTTDKHLVTNFYQQDWGLLGFDLSMLMFGLGFAFAAKKVHRNNTAKPSNIGSIESQFETKALKT